MARVGDVGYRRPSVDEAVCEILGLVSSCNDDKSDVCRFGELSRILNEWEAKIALKKDEYVCTLYEECKDDVENIEHNLDESLLAVENACLVLDKFNEELPKYMKSVMDLQTVSAQLSVRLANQRKLLTEIVSFVDDILVTASLSSRICSKTKGEDSFTADDCMVILTKLNNAIQRQTHLNRDMMMTTRGGGDMMKTTRGGDMMKTTSQYYPALREAIAVLESLKAKAIEAITERLLNSLNAFKDPLSNVPVLQQTILRNLDGLYKFLLTAESPSAISFQQSYEICIGSLYLSQTKNYILNVPTESNSEDILNDTILPNLGWTNESTTTNTGFLKKSNNTDLNILTYSQLLNMLPHISKLRANNVLCISDEEIEATPFLPLGNNRVTTDISGPTITEFYRSLYKLMSDTVTLEAEFVCDFFPDQKKTLVTTTPSSFHSNQQMMASTFNSVFRYLDDRNTRMVRQSSSVYDLLIIATHATHFFQRAHTSKALQCFRYHLFMLITSCLKKLQSTLQRTLFQMDATQDITAVIRHAQDSHMPNVVLAATLFGNLIGVVWYCAAIVEKSLANVRLGDQFANGILNEFFSAAKLGQELLQTELNCLTEASSRYSVVIKYLGCSMMQRSLTDSIKQISDMNEETTTTESGDKTSVFEVVRHFVRSLETYFGAAQTSLAEEILDSTTPTFVGFIRDSEKKFAETNGDVSSLPSIEAVKEMAEEQKKNWKRDLERVESTVKKNISDIDAEIGREAIRQVFTRYLLYYARWRKIFELTCEKETETSSMLELLVPSQRIFMEIKRYYGSGC